MTDTRARKPQDSDRGPLRCLYATIHPLNMVSRGGTLNFGQHNCCLSDRIKV
ncbi:MAG: hypothetical protein SVV80_08245 [Planctomycetota bacterium]|nr:hypothetical protein [Planctomycetota bacterium]